MGVKEEVKTPKSKTRNFPLDRKKQKRAKNPDPFRAKAERDKQRREKHCASVNRRNWATSVPSLGWSAEEPIACLMNYTAAAEVKQKRRKQRLVFYSSHNSTSSQGERASWRSSQKRLCKKFACSWLKHLSKGGKEKVNRENLNRLHWNYLKLPLTREKADCLRSKTQ